MIGVWRGCGRGAIVEWPEGATIMSGRETCRACGVVLPGPVIRCPACGARLLRGRVAIGIVAAIVAIAAVVGVSQFRRPRLDPALKGGVQASAGFVLSLDQKQTDVTGFIDNNNQVPVDVTVRIRGHDYGDNIVADFESGPYRKLAPGVSLPIRATLDLTPVKSVSIDVVEVAPSKP
jgi:hypothetical protein